MVSGPSIDLGKWWQSGVVYQVYPRSFQDADGDGVGDLRGVRSRLDYLEWLGIDAVWLSPIFRSPMADFGYDVADYEDVDPMFGTLDDLDELLRDIHGRGMRLLLDLVPNHTSSEHRWFIESRSSRAAARRDWYIWRDPLPDGSPPNDWQALFGGSAWQWDEHTGQFYFHSFLQEQPDLNWRNPAVRAAMFDVMRFWFRRGVDGFRIDVVQLLAKRFELEPAPLSARRPTRSDDPMLQRWAATPAIHTIMRQLRSVADEFDDRVLVGELWLPVQRLVKFYGRDLSGLHLPFNFQLITLPWKASVVHRAVVRYEGALPEGAWPNWVLGNHDRSRIASRAGVAQARVAAILLLTLRGTPTMYYGDELGMIDADIPGASQRDPQGLRGGDSRDPERTPMRWDPSPSGGFTDGAQPWLPMGADVERINVAALRDEPDSVLSLYRRLLALRRTEPALSVGDWRDLGRRGSVFAFIRSHAERRFLIILNMSGGSATLPVAAQSLRGRVLISTLTPDEVSFDPTRHLQPNEALVVRLD